MIKWVLIAHLEIFGLKNIIEGSKTNQMIKCLDILNGVTNEAYKNPLKYLALSNNMHYLIENDVDYDFIVYSTVMRSYFKKIFDENKLGLWSKLIY
jgi:hypothetical protein